MSSLAAAFVLVLADAAGPAPAALEMSSGAVAAAAYLAVAEEERAAGNAEAACVAFREALRRDPESTAARAGVAASCVQPQSVPSALEPAAPAGPSPDEELATGLLRMQDQDRPGAIAAFKRARARGPMPTAALLQAICQYELGEDEDARAALAEAEADPALGDTALFFRGLIAYRAGRLDEAAPLLERLAGLPQSELRRQAGELLGLARRDGRFVASLSTDVIADSNVQLAPDGTPVPGGRDDVAASQAAALSVRPLGISGPYVLATGVYRRQARLESFDLAALGAAAGWRFGTGRRHLTAEYGYDYITLGREPYLSAHRAQASARLGTTTWSGGASYVARWEVFLSDLGDGFSGSRQTGELDLAWSASRARVGLVYQVTRNLTETTSYSHWDHGPVAVASFAPVRQLRLDLRAGAALRAYEYDATIGARRDTHLIGLAAAEWELGARWLVRVTVTGRKAWSNIDELGFTRVTGALALVYTFGVS